MIESRSLPSAAALEDVLERGHAALAAGRIDGALRTFDAAIRIKPTYAPAWRAKGRALRAAGDPHAAVGCYAEAIRHEPEDDASWFGLALALRALGRREDEARAYDELLRRNPRNVAALTNRGVAFHEAGRFEEALACCDRILSLRPEIAAAWNNRGAALLRLGRLEEAVTSFNEALALDPASGDAASNRRTALAKLRRDEPPPDPIAVPPSSPLPVPAQIRVLANLGLVAIDAFRDAPPTQAADFVALGTALLDDGKLAAAASAFAKAEELGGGATAVLGRLAALEVLRDPRLPDEAWRSLAAYPTTPRVALTVARVRESVGDVPGALEALGPLLEERAGLAWAWNARGVLELRLGRVADARASFERAADADPFDADAWANLAAARHREGDAEGALAACDRALSVRPTHPAAWNNRGIVLASLGKPGAADACLRRAAGEADDVGALLNRARLAESRGRYRLAVKWYGEALVGAPGLPEARAGRRRALGRLGAEARARRRTPRSQKRKGKNPRPKPRGM